MLTSRARSKLIPSFFLDLPVPETCFFPLLTHSWPPLEHLLLGPNFSSCRCPWSFFLHSGRRLVVFSPYIPDGSPYPFDLSRRCRCCPYFSLLRLLVFRSLAHFPPPGSSARPLGLRNCSPSWATLGPASILITTALVAFGVFMILEGVGACTLVLDKHGVSRRPSRYRFFLRIYLIIYNDQ